MRDSFSKPASAASVRRLRRPKPPVRSSLAVAPPVVAAGELTVAAESFPVLDLQFGSTVDVVLVFRQPGAAAPQGSDYGHDSDLLGAGVAVHTQTGDECSFVDFDHFSERNAINARLVSEWDGAAYSTVARGPREAKADGSGEASGLGRNSPSETQTPVGAFDPSPTNRPDGGGASRTAWRARRTVSTKNYPTSRKMAR